MTLRDVTLCKLYIYSLSIDYGKRVPYVSCKTFRVPSAQRFEYTHYMHGYRHRISTVYLLFARTRL